MIEDLNRVSSEASHAIADVCIVGAGAAGIALALHLAEAGRSVVLLESGGERLEDDTQDLYAGTVSSERLHSPTDKYRQRRLGGATPIWGGRCVPFDPIDFEARDHVPGSGWPIRPEEVDPYYEKANELLEAGENAYDASKLNPTFFTEMFRGFRSETVSTDTLERFSCPTDMGRRYRDRLRVAPNVRLILHANVTKIQLDESGRHVESVHVSSLHGAHMVVRARHFVLATGGIEAARLLLASNDVHAQGVGNNHDQVGRYYMCHIAGNVGTLTIERPLDHVHHGYMIAPEGVYCRRRLQLVPEVQRRERVPNMVARLHFPKITDPSHRNGVLSGLFVVRNFISYEYGKRLKDDQAGGWGHMAHHWMNIVRDSPDTAGFLWHWLRKRTLADRKFPSVILRNRTNRFSLEVHAEQIPRADSRVTLGTQVDALGMRRVHVDWRYSKADIEGVARSLSVMARAFEASGVGRFEFDEETLEEDLTRYGAYGGHHIGTTRMGDDPQCSVVDRNGTVHGISNLHVASSSVFPTSSQANPTLLIVAMALRLGDHLGHRIGVEGR